ncbi:MAG: hypothetical protein Q9218_002773 [Villophora microphyllina]
MPAFYLTALHCDWIAAIAHHYKGATAWDMSLAFSRIAHIGDFADDDMYKFIHFVKEQKGVSEGARNYFKFWADRVDPSKTKKMDSEGRRRLAFYIWMYETNLVEEELAIAAAEENDPQMKAEAQGWLKNEKKLIAKARIEPQDYVKERTVAEQMEFADLFNKDNLGNQSVYTVFRPVFRKLFGTYPQSRTRLSVGSSDDVPQFDPKRDQLIKTWLDERAQKNGTQRSHEKRYKKMLQIEGPPLQKAIEGPPAQQA